MSFLAENGWCCCYSENSGRSIRRLTHPTAGVQSIRSHSVLKAALFTALPVVREVL